MSDEVSDSLSAAVAVIRANLAAMQDPRKHKAAFDTLLLEVTTNDAPENVLCGLATIASGAILGMAAFTGRKPSELLDSMEKQFSEGEES